MFEFNQTIPGYHNPYLKYADAVSGSLFYIAALYALSNELFIIGAIYAAVATTSIAHLFLPFRYLRIADYLLAVTCVIICLQLVIVSGFPHPWSTLAAVCCGASLAIYALYQQKRHYIRWTFLYFIWHVGALATSLLSLIAFVTSTG